jgi:hypothetical protein
MLLVIQIQLDTNLEKVKDKKKTLIAKGPFFVFYTNLKMLILLMQKRH